ncbi:MAG TPA: hypothetical protein VF092_22930 [Longimicrobium sp.]
MIRSLALLALLGAAPVAAHAQIGFPGGIRESGRQVVDAGQPVQLVAAATAAPKVNWFFGPAGRVSDNASGFSGAAGFSWEGAVPVEAALGYARSEPDGVDGTNAFSATVEVGVPSKALASLGTTLAVSGEGVWVVDVAQSYTAAASLTQELGSHVEVVGSMAYGRTDPEAGLTTTGFRPGASLAVVPAKGTQVRVEYTFDNDLDGEDSVELRVAQRVAPRGVIPFQLRGGIAKHGVVSVGILFFP